MFKNGCSPLLPFWVISLELTLEWKACALKSYTLLIYFDDIWYRSRRCVKFKNDWSPLLSIELSPLNNLKRGKLLPLLPIELSPLNNLKRGKLLPLLPFELSPLNNLKRGKLLHLLPLELSPLNKLKWKKLVRSLIISPFEIFRWYLVYIYIRSRWYVTCKNCCCPFELSSLNELYRGKLVSTIIVNIPYLLALTLSITSNIYTRLLIIYFEVRGFAISSQMAVFLKYPMKSKIGLREGVGGPGGGGYSQFSSYVGSGPASTLHPQKISGISSSPKKYWNFSNPKKYPHSVKYPKNA